MKAQVVVKLKQGVLDPQGKAIVNSLHTMGFPEIGDVVQGKIFEIELKTENRINAESLLQTVSEKLLANTIIEDFEVKLL